MSLDPQAGLVDVFFGVAALFTLVTILRSRATFWDADLTGADKRLATQAAVFVVPPVVVLVHELGHLLAAVACGAEILGFHYGVFEGSVSYAGTLTPAQDWFVALAGNLAGAATGLVMAFLAIRFVRWRPALRYVLLLGGVLQVAWALVGYPLLSLSSRWGDWVVIYDFEATPLLSWATLGLHAGVLYALWRWWRGTVRRALFAIGSGAGDEADRLVAAAEERPGDVDAWLSLATLYARHGELALARSTLEQAAAGDAGSSARLHLARARLAVIEGRWSPAVVAAGDGLRVAGAGDVDVVQRLWANQGVALASMAKPADALAAFEHVGSPIVDDTRVRYCRGLARLGAGDIAGGRDDLDAVVRSLPPGNLLRSWAEARLEGRVPEPPDDSDRPNYLRRTHAPPAPIAGV